MTSEDELYLAGTAEVPLAAFHMGEIIDEAELPVRYAGYSSCFRREAGTYGKDMGGMFRVHQFDKVEMFAFTTPETLGRARAPARGRGGVIGNLEIPYRVVNIAAGDLGGSAAKKYDIEGWLPGQGRYRELTSCSNTTDYQARRMQTRVRRAERRRRGPPHPQRHRHRDRPDVDRDHREPPAPRRQRGDPRAAAALPARASARVAAARRRSP